MGNSLELNKYDVNEITADEYQEIDGGFPLIPLIIGGSVVLYGLTKLVWDVSHRRQFKLFGPW
ncbi:hypothetical protein QUF70_08710 [Desulfobacterales bacterium HSG17]|nr:hypothetical protein [Desulfobacterales bacterium HSG17]